MALPAGNSSRVIPPKHAARVVAAVESIRTRKSRPSRLWSVAAAEEENIVLLLGVVFTLDVDSRRLTNALEVPPAVLCFLAVCCVEMERESVGEA